MTHIKVIVTGHKRDTQWKEDDIGYVTGYIYINDFETRAIVVMNKDKSFQSIPLEFIKNVE